MEFKNDDKYWDANADEWDALIDEGGDPFRQGVMDKCLWGYLGDIEGLTFLDAGCGTGYFSRLLKKKGAARVVGVDYSKKMIENSIRRAEESGLDIEHRVDSATSLATIEDNSIDRIVTIGVLNAVDDLDATIRSFARVLKDGGEVVGSMHHICFEDPVKSDDPNNPFPVYKWEHSYFEETRVVMPPMLKFESEFIRYDRPLSQYFKTFKKNGFVMMDFDEPRLEEDIEGMDVGMAFRYKNWPFTMTFHFKLKSID